MASSSDCKENAPTKDLGQGCSVCLEENKADLNFPCGHSFCSECFFDYAFFEIIEGRTQLSCMECSASAPDEAIQSVLLSDKALKAKYEAFSLRQALLEIENCRFCPTPDCGYAVIADPECTRLQCLNGCPDFCYICNEVAHEGDCRAGIAKVLKELESHGYRVCPRCAVPVTKTGGCNSVVCHCGCEFCWMCGRPCREALHFLPHKPCRQFSGRPPVKASTRLKKYSIALAASPLLVPLGAIGGAAFAVYVGKEKAHALVRSIPASKKKRRVVAGSIAVTSSVVWAPVLGATGMAVTVVGLTGYFVGFPAFLLHDHVVDKRRKKKNGDSTLFNIGKREEKLGIGSSSTTAN